MTATHYLNLAAAIFVVATLAGVCRLAFLLAGGRLDRRPAQLAQGELAPLFAEPGHGSLARREDAAA